MDFASKQKLYAFYENYLTDERKELFESVVTNRTRHLTYVLEDIYQPQNASAVLRTCDSTGIQDVHIIENKHEYVINPKVTVGCSKWLTLHRYNEHENNTLDCLNKLKNSGYKLIATSPHKNDCTINELPLDNKTALIFGTEKWGISDIVKDHADGFTKIPMYGFSESFNISVSAAIIASELLNRLRSQNKIQWQLSEEEIIDLKIEWSEKTIKRPDLLKQEFLSRMG